MAKRRKVIGSVVKGKTENGVKKPDYIKISQDVTLKAGSFVNLESKESQLESLAKAEAEGKISAENAAKVRSAVEKIPDFVRFNLSITEG